MSVSMTTSDLLKQLQDRLASGTSDDLLQDKVSALYALVEKEQPETPAPPAKASEPKQECPPAPKKRRRDPEPTGSDESLKQDSKKTKAAEAKEDVPVSDADYMEYVELAQSFTETGREYRRIGKEKDTLSLRIIADMKKKDVKSHSPEEDVTFTLSTKSRANVLTMDVVKRVLKEQLEEDLANKLIKLIQESKGSTEKDTLTIV